MQTENQGAALHQKDSWDSAFGFELFLKLLIKIQYVKIALAD